MFEYAYNGTQKQYMCFIFRKKKITQLQLPPRMQTKESKNEIKLVYRPGSTPRRPSDTKCNLATDSIQPQEYFDPLQQVVERG